jgi:hypothetical protein
MPLPPVAATRLDLLEEELRAAGFRTPDRIYAVSYDGGTALTAEAAYPLVWREA